MKQQEGFAFITYLTEDAAIRSANAYNNVMIRGILLVTTLSYRNPKPQLNPFTMGMQQQQNHFSQHHSSPRSIGSAHSIGYSLSSDSSNQSPSSSYYNLPTAQSSLLGVSNSNPQSVNFPSNYHVPYSSQYVIQAPPSNSMMPSNTFSGQPSWGTSSQPHNTLLSMGLGNSSNSNVFQQPTSNSPPSYSDTFNNTVFHNPSSAMMNSNHLEVNSTKSGLTFTSLSSANTDTTFP